MKLFFHREISNTRYKSLILECKKGKDVAMHGNERRECIRKDLKKSLKAIKGSELALKYDVSRQVIVQDIALLRAVGEQIISTGDGYIYFSYHMNKPKKVFAVRHEESQIENEIDAILEYDGTLLNVFINHPIYGDLVADMIIENKQQKRDYIKRCSEVEFMPLMALTDNYHYHTVEANTEEDLENIEKLLRKLGFLVE